MVAYQREKRNASRFTEEALLCNFALTYYTEIENAWNGRVKMSPDIFEPSTNSRVKKKKK